MMICSNLQCETSILKVLNIPQAIKKISMSLTMFKSFSSRLLAEIGYHRFWDLEI